MSAFKTVGTFAIATLHVVRACIFLMLDSICMIFPAPRRRVVVVLKLDAVGDFFVWLQSGALDISRYARRTDDRVVLLANRFWADYARSTGLWDQVIDVEPVRLMRSPLYRMRLMWRVRRTGARLLIQPRAARIFLQEDAISRVSGATLKVGSGGLLVNMTPLVRRLGNRYYDQLIAVSQQLNVHETARNGEFVLGLTGKLPTRFALDALHPGESSDTVAIAIGAGWVGRVWPVEKLADLIRHVRSVRPSWGVVLLGSSTERQLADRLEHLVGGQVNNQIGKTSLHDYVEVIARSRLVICNESSAYHIAMALSRNVMCFVGGGHFGWFAPYPSTDSMSTRAKVLSVQMDCFGCNWHCKYPREANKAVLCVESISLQNAIDSLDSMIGRV